MYAMTPIGKAPVQHVGGHIGVNGVLCREHIDLNPYRVGRLQEVRHRHDMGW